MDEQQLAQLRDWARRLERAGDSAELRAAGRALELAAAEIDRLKAQLAAAAAAPEAPAPESARRERPRRRSLRRPFDLEADEEDEADLAPQLQRAAADSARRAAPVRRNGARPGGERVHDRDRPARRYATGNGSGRSSDARDGRASALGGLLEAPPPVVVNGGNGRAASNGEAALPAPQPARRARPARPAIRLPVRPLLVAAGVVATLVAVAAGAARVLAPEFDPSGPPRDALVGAAAVRDLVFEARADDGTLRDLSWVLDGKSVKGRVVRRGDVARLAGAAFSDGEHWLTVRADGWLPGSRTEHTWHFTIDRTPPLVRVDPAARRAPVFEPYTFRGTTDPGSEMRINDRPVELEGGRFAVAYAQPPQGQLRVEVTDRFGNASASWIDVEIVPRAPRAPLRAVHVTSHAWADPTLRRGIMALIDQGKIDAVELDLKDESGEVGFTGPIPLARQIGAMRDIYDLEQAIRTLHGRGIMVVGRIVAFRDPVHAAAAWKRGWRDQVIQTPGGEPYAGYGGFTNFASPAVRKYNIDIARVAAAAGIDDILYDYVRRPDGPTSTMRFPGLRGTPERSVATFLAEARQALKPYGTFLGASVFGVAATRPTEVAQDVRAIGRNVDYVAPMLYPSHWGPGEYDVANPNAEPYAIIRRSLADFKKQVRGTGARVVPWLQDFSLGVTYGPAEVSAQIRAAKDAGIDEWLLWDPNVTYTAGGLPKAPTLDPYTAQKPKPAPKQTAAAAPAPARGTAAAAPAGAAAAKANELGEVPVLMYHQIRADGGGDYDLTPAQFRAELQRLWREGYRPIRASDLVNGTIDVPAGKSPVVLTFDDSTKEQLFLDAQGEIAPDTAIGIMLDFARSHPGFEPAGTFYVNREPFAGVAEGPELLRWLHEHGFELGNHTKDHIPLNQLSATEAQRQLVLGRKVILDAVPQAAVTTVALPLGGWPEPRSLAWRGRWNSQEYRHRGVFMVGAEPAKSPFSRGWDAHAIPRIRTTPKGAAEPEWGSSWWLDILRTERGRRYVSDGDPKTISFPRGRQGELAERFAGRARSY